VNESGVTFNTPMTSPCRETSKTRSPILQILSRITIQTKADAPLFESLPATLCKHRKRMEFVRRSQIAAEIIFFLCNALSIRPVRCHELSSPHSLHLASRQRAKPVCDRARTLLTN